MLVVCMNPTMDRQVFLPELRPGSVSRATRNRRLAGGKPVDVLRAMAAHDFRPTLLVVLPEHNEGYLGLLGEEGITAEPYQVPGHLRETIICYEDSGRSTVINGQGQAMAESVWEPLRDELVRRAAAEDWVVLSGSFPPGVSAEQVSLLVADLRAAGTKVALDTGPAWLAAALTAGPDLITPNLAEAQQALSEQHGVESVEFGEGALDEALATAQNLAARGLRHVVVTVGSAGAAWASSEGSGVCPSLRVDTVNPIGAGDAFLGGLLATLARGEDFGEAVAMGTATAASAVLQWIPGRADAAQVLALREELR